jgi:hypothetical protein
MSKTTSYRCTGRWILTALLLAGIASCGSHRYGKPYKNAGQARITRAYQGDCEVLVYADRSGEKLNGSYLVRVAKNQMLTGNFADGLLRDTVKQYYEGRLTAVLFYEKGIKTGRNTEIYSAYRPKGQGETRYREVISYKNGFRDGIMESYTNEIMTRKTLYENGRKTGTEYYFDEKGDTAATVSYQYLAGFSPPEWDMAGHAYLKYHRFKGTMVLTTTGNVDPSDFTVLMDMISYDTACPGNEYYIVEAYGRKWLCFFSPGNVYTRIPFGQ